MKSRALAFAAIAAIASLCLTHPAYGQDDVTVNFSGGGSTTWIGPNPDGSGNIDVYAGIYNGTVSGIPGANPGIVCDDYQDTVVAGESWTATALNAASLATGNNINETLFGATIGLEGYAEVATLVSDMFNGKSGYTQAELSSAIWYITSAGNATLSASLWSALDANAQALVTSLQKEFSGNLSAAEAALAGFSNLWILTPVPDAHGGPQEMWVEAAEGGAAMAYLLLAAFSCCGALFLRRRQQTRLFCHSEATYQ
jgi:hypothetical protein